MVDFAETLREIAAASAARRSALALDEMLERGRAEREAAHRVDAVKTRLLLSLTDEQLEGRAPVSPAVAEAWVQVFPDRPIIDGHLATGAQMARLEEMRERRELVAWLVEQGRTPEEARAAIAVEYGGPEPAQMAEARIVDPNVGTPESRAAQAKIQADVLDALGVLPDPDPAGDVAALSGINYVEAFREAGFTAQAAEEGARRVAIEQRAGRYLGFGVVVAELKSFGGHRLLIRPHLSEAVVQRIEADEKTRRGSRVPAGAAPRHPIQESAPTLDPATVTAAAGTPVPVVLITPGWGSTGYYSPQVLEQAARDRVIPAGTQMYADHPSQSQRQDRPERSVRDLVGVLTEDAQWNGRELVSKAQFFPPHDQQFREMASAIGLSILGSATDIRHGTAEGRTGPIVEGLARVDSVDVVTRAGRGGRIIAS